MKRIDFIKYLESRNCVFKREGGNHTIYINELNNKISTIPRHKEIKKYLCKKICKDLDIPSPLK